MLRPEAPCPSRTTISCFFRPSQTLLLEVPPCLRRPNDAGYGTPRARPTRPARPTSGWRSDGPRSTRDLLAAAVYDPVTVEDFLSMPRTGPDGEPVKLTSNILRNEKWVGVRKGSVKVPNAI